MARLRDRVQNALDEARLLILGAQVLLGFEYRSVFERGFEQLPEHSRYLKLVGLAALLITFALLIWPGSYHRIVNKGVDSEELHQFTTRVMTCALLPFALALGLDMFVASERVAGPFIGIVVGSFAAILAIYFWYLLEAIERKRHKESNTMSATRAKSITKLRDKIKHVLTEARVVLPGAQTLLGFQLITFLMDGFEKLPNILKYVHLVSLCLTAVSIILLMTPAAYHRIVERGEETEHFHRFASKTLLAAMAPLAIAVCSDFCLVLLVVTGSEELALFGGGVMLLLFFGLWFVMPAYWRATATRRTPHRSRASVAQG